MPRRNYKSKPARPDKYVPSSDDCREKKRFQSKLAAEQASDELEIINPGLKLSVYKCNSCGGWHLTRLGAKM